jgi:hypothetical protein
VKAFLYKLAGLALFVALSTGAFFFILVRMADRKTDWKLDPSVHTIIIGDSHTETALNDTLLSNTRNFSKSAETYIFSISKARAIIRDNHGIEKIIISFGYHNLAAENYSANYFDDWGIRFLSRYCYLMRIDELWNVVKSCSRNAVKKMNRCFSTMLSIVLTKSRHDAIHDPQYGGYYFLVRDKLEKDMARQDSLASAPPDEFRASWIQQKYLNEIIELCRKYQIEPVLLNAPVHPYYRRFTARERDYYYRYVGDHLKGACLLDYSNLALPDSCYGDLTHLNYRGARVFSRIFNDRMESLGQNVGR